MNDTKEVRQRSFTGDKLDWMTALMADTSIASDAKVVGFCIAQHINAETGLAILSDDTIADKTGISKREVLRARMDLRSASWINWKRTGSANVYWTLGDPIQAIMMRQQSLKKVRDGKRQARAHGRSDVTALAHLKARDVTTLAHLPPSKTTTKPRDVTATSHHDVTPLAHHDVTRLANIHRRENTLSIIGGKHNRASSNRTRRRTATLRANPSDHLLVASPARHADAAVAVPVSGTMPVTAGRESPSQSAPS
jgi:hypothetical protein